MIYLINQTEHIGGGQNSFKQLVTYCQHFLPEKQMVSMSGFAPFSWAIKSHSTFIISLYYPSIYYIIFFLTARIRGNKVIFLNHNDWALELQDIGGFSFYTLVMQDVFLYFYCLLANRIIIFSDYHKELLNKKFNFHQKFLLYPVLKQKKSFINKKKARKQLHVSQTSTIILFAGRVQPRKGLQLVIQGLSHIVEKREDTLLLIVFPSDIFSFTEKLDQAYSLVSKLGLSSHVRFISGVKPSEMSQYYKASDIFVMSSTHLETLGWTFLEALSQGLPVVSFDSGFPGEVVKKYFPEMLAKKKRPKDLAQVIIKILGKYSFFRNQVKKETMHLFHNLERNGHQLKDYLLQIDEH